MSDIKVSVIIPVYNVENYLERAVQSVLNQTLEQIEIILVDDGSPDNSAAICDFFKDSHPDKVKVIHKQNEGLGLARNSGLDIAKGEYVAFMDSDDTVEPQMYQCMYEKAVTGNFDVVMCDVNIIYVGKGLNKISKCYNKTKVDLCDYLKNGQNLTYSVNKLYKRGLWQQIRYEKMLFEDIALIPAFLSFCKSIGYVAQPFYNYYRREGTISTTPKGDTFDIIKAYEKFLDSSNKRFSEQMVYAAAKQILWNMTDARPLFLADFIDFLNRYKSRFLLNPYIQKDPNVKKILAYIDKEVIPDNIICVALNGRVEQEYLSCINENFKGANLVIVDKNYFEINSLPECVKKALKEQRYSFAAGYYAVRALYELGGIVLFDSMRPNLNLKSLRCEQVFFGFEDQSAILEGCFGAVKKNYVIQAILDSFLGDNIYNMAYLPLSERLRDFLIVNFGLNPNGRKQLLGGKVQILLPSVLAYDFKDGQNCCKKALPAPEGFELISDSAIKFLSDRVLENWNLYKSACGQLEKARLTPAPKQKAEPQKVFVTKIDEAELNRRIDEVVNTYESSTSWKVTRPLRAIGRLFKR